MSLSEESQNPAVPAVQGIADNTNQGTAGVGVFGCVGLPDTGLSGAPPLSSVGVYGSTVAISNPVGIGVYGASSAGLGVYGISATNIGVKGESQQFDAVQGVSHSSQHAGVSGQNDSSGGFGVWANSPNGTGIYGHSTAGVGIQGESQDSDAVNGLSHTSQHAGVAGHNDAGGAGVWAVGTPAGYFSGDVTVTGTITGGANINVTGTISAGANINVIGTITVGTDIIFSNAADFAEDFDLANSSAAEPGTVMVLGEFGGIEPSQREYDGKVAGVISGAGEYKPGLILDRRPTGNERGTLALVGKVFCKVDAAFGGIHPGDMLTTSPTPGYAMRVGDRTRAFGSVIGKALGTCESGRGLVPILIALQ